MAFVMFEFLIFTRLTRLKGLVSTLFNLYCVVGENFCGGVAFFWLFFSFHFCFVAHRIILNVNV
jgi:hypothetical protein